jgi:hypothetical protein
MRTFYRHRALNFIFLIAFIVYAISPVFFHLQEESDFLPGERGDERIVKKMFVVDFLFNSFLSHDCGAADEAGDAYVLVKKRRVVLKRLDSVTPPADVLLCEIPDDASDVPIVDFVRVDHKANPKESKGFLPKYSGLSPPVV